MLGSNLHRTGHSFSLFVVVQPICHLILEHLLDRARDNASLKLALDAVKDVVERLKRGLRAHPREHMDTSDPGDWGAIKGAWYLLSARKSTYNAADLSSARHTNPRAMNDPSDHVAGQITAADNDELAALVYRWITVPARRHGTRPFHHMKEAFLAAVLDGTSLEWVDAPAPPPDPQPGWDSEGASFAERAVTSEI